MQSARRIKDKNHADITLLAVLAERATDGRDSAGAFTMARQMGGKALVARCATLVALGNVKRGHHLAAENMIQVHRLGPEHRDVVYAALAVAQAEAGLAKNAYESVDRIFLPPLRRRHPARCRAPRPTR